MAELGENFGMDGGEGKNYVIKKESNDHKYIMMHTKQFLRNEYVCIKTKLTIKIQLTILNTNCKFYFIFFF